MDGLQPKQGIAVFILGNIVGLPSGNLTICRESRHHRRIFDGFGLFAGFGIGNSRCKPLGFGQQKNTEKRIERD